MAVKIRLRSQGSTNRIMYRLVVTDERSPRDGKYLEAVGWYNPFAKQEQERVFVKPDRIQHWIDCGAQLSDRAESLIKKAAPAVIQLLDQKRKSAAEKARKKK
jgi:small subunit ribosomal protein S16